MIPAKVFLQSIRCEGESSSSLKLNLILNDLFYDELKQYHTKYICVTATDVLTLELYRDQQLLGTVAISQLYKHVVDQRTIEVKLASKLTPNDITIALRFEPVTSFNRKKTSSPNRRYGDTIKSPVRQKTNIEDIFFSQREPLVETSPLQTNIRGSRLAAQRTQTVQLSEGESLQSLAQQREKILGELFGKFKRDI